MSNDQNQQEFRLKIARVDAKGKVLDFADAIEFKRDKGGCLDEGKLILNYTEYDTTSHKANLMLKHFIDLDVARRLFSDILNLKIRKDPSSERAGMYLPLVDEYKGGSGRAAKHEEWEWASRHLVVNYNDQLRIGAAFVFNFMLGEGEATATGAIKPKYKDAPFKGQIMVPVDKARAVAAQILDYISCKQTAQMMIALQDGTLQRERFAA